MGNTRKTGGKQAARVAPAQFSDEGRSALVDLGRRFARFREKHARGTRLPWELKDAALAVLPKVPPEQLYRTCGVTFRQVMAWKSEKARRAGVPADVRVFTVVGGEAEDTERVQEPAPTEFELRLGPWSVRVKLTGPVPSERGPACYR